MIPAKRIKGCLRSSAAEILDYLKSIPGSGSAPPFIDAGVLDEIFGTPGREKEAPVFFSNLFVECYGNLLNILRSYFSEYPDIFSIESVLDTFTYTRQQTSIDQGSGTAKPHTLRTIRVLARGNQFQGSIFVENANQRDRDFERLLALACINLRNIGTSRTRGFGEVECRIFDGDSDRTDQVLQDLRVHLGVKS